MTPNQITDIKNLLQNKNPKSWVQMINRRIDLKTIILNDFPGFHLNEALYLIVNDMTANEAPKAPCGNKCKFINGKYSLYCEKPTKHKGNHEYCEVCNSVYNKSKNEVLKQNNIKKYGVESTFQIQEVKEKIKSTLKQKYNTEHNSYIPSVIEKRKLTSLLHYGTDNPLKSTSVKEKIKSTLKQKYNTDNYGKTKECVEKRKATMLEKYGVDNALHYDPSVQKLKLTNAITRFNRIKEKLESTSYYELFEYDDLIDCTNDTLLPYFCEKHGLFYSAKYNIRCSECNPLTLSTIQYEVLSFIESTNIKCISNDRSMLDGKEIDILCPDINIAIEVNGMYWHRDEICNKNYHQQKVLLCKDKGIKLIHIFEDEWMYKKELVQQRLLNILNKSERIYARKCSVNIISAKDAKYFIDKYHIQGYCNSSINVGLFYNNELKAVMTFGKSRFDKSIQYELLRYCSNGTVVGGASKLLKYFESTYHPESLISYADMNWSSGNLYDKLGFEFKGITNPGFFYYNPKTKLRISRQKCQKHILVKKGYDPSMTAEYICCNILGYYKIYDSGNLKYTKYYK